MSLPTCDKTKMIEDKQSSDSDCLRISIHDEHQHDELIATLGFRHPRLVAPHSISFPSH